jgi:flagellar hook-associated protein 3 FlgL
MRVPTYAFSSTLITQLQNLSTQQGTLENEVSTGQSITNPSDNPSSAEQVMNDQAEQQQLAQYSNNNTVAMDISNSSYSAVSALQTLVDRATQLATLGSGVTSADSQSAYATEVNSMIQEAVNGANSTYNGNYLFGGTANNSAPFVLNSTTGYYEYAGSSTSAQIETAEGSFTSPYTDAASNQGMADFINNLVDLRNSLQGASGAPALSTVAANLDDSETSIVNTVSSIGATQTGLEADEAENTSKFNTLTNLISTDSSADIAQTTVKLTAAQTAYQAALESGAKILQMSLINYLN